MQLDGRSRDPIHPPSHRQLERFSMGIEAFKIFPATRVVGKTHADETFALELARIVNPRRVGRVEIREHFWMVGAIEHDRRGDLEAGGDDRQWRMIALVPEPRDLEGGL